jgi:hypothetical protein
LPLPLIEGRNFIKGITSKQFRGKGVTSTSKALKVEVSKITPQIDLYQLVTIVVGLVILQESVDN